MIKTLKTKQFRIVATLLALVITVSCVAWNAPRVHAAELSIDDAIAQGYSLFGNSRIIVDDKLVGNAAYDATIGIFVTGGTADKYKATNMKWKHNGSRWSNESGNAVLFENTTDQKICAYSPYNENATYDNGIFVTATDQIDWLVATEQTLGSANMSLNMKHAMAKLVLNPTFGTEVAAGTTISKVEVAGMYASGKLHFNNNTWTDLSEKNETLKMNESNELLVIPMDSIDSFTVTVTMSDGKVFKSTVSLTDAGNKLESGTQYTINLQIGQDKVNVVGITASEWASQEGGNLATD